MNNIDKDKQCSQPGQDDSWLDGNAAGEWHNGDIDWSCYEGFRESLFAVHANSAGPHRELLRAAIIRLKDVVSGIQSFDPRYRPPLRWGDDVIYQGKVYKLEKPIDRDEVQLSAGEGIIQVPWSAISAAPYA